MSRKTTRLYCLKLDNNGSDILKYHLVAGIDFPEIIRFSTPASNTLLLRSA